MRRFAWFVVGLMTFIITFVLAMNCYIKASDATWFWDGLSAWCFGISAFVFFCTGCVFMINAFGED